MFSSLYHLVTHLRSGLPAAVAAVALASSPSVAPAQSRPYADEGDRTSDLAELYAPGSSVTGFPSYEVNAVPPARAAAAVARAEYHRAHSTLNNETRATVRRNERSEEMTEALEAEAAAYEAFESARRSALRAVYDDPNYQANTELRRSIARQLAEAREAAYEAFESARRSALRAVYDDPNYQANTELRRSIARQLAEAREAEKPRTEQIVALAAMKLDYAAAATAREQEILDGNDQVADARAKLVAARRRISELRERHLEDVRTNPDLVAARKALYDTKVSRLAAEAYLRGVLDARDIALTYTYNRLFRYNPYRGFASYGHPYGYGAVPYGGY